MSREADKLAAAKRQAEDAVEIAAYGGLMWSLLQVLGTVWTFVAFGPLHGTIMAIMTIMTGIVTWGYFVRSRLLAVLGVVYVLVLVLLSFVLTEDMWVGLITLLMVGFWARGAYYVFQLHKMPSSPPPSPRFLFRPPDR